ncbi:hypothetical protein ACNKHS_01065 [Shigella flexneri]
MHLNNGTSRVKSLKIGIIGAMEEEVTLLRDKIENRQTLSLGGCEISPGQLNGVDVALLKIRHRVKLQLHWARPCCLNAASLTLSLIRVLRAGWRRR